MLGSSSRESTALTRFFAVLAGLAAIRLTLGFVSFPIAVLPALNLALAAIFLAAPVLAVYWAADRTWTPRSVGLFLVSGLVIWGVSIAMDLNVFGGKGVASAVVNAIGQVGLATWCVGLGALLTSLLREKNILVPVAIFLAVWDAFLVLTPVGPTSQFLKNAPQVLNTIGMSIPIAASEPTTGRAAVGAYVGPADLVFLGTFFVALFRFEMRTKETLRWMIPALVAYLVVVLVFGLPLPALVPIGLVVMLVNWREFKLSKDEKLSTLVVAAIGIGLVAWGATRPRPTPPAEPSTVAPAQERGVPGVKPSPEPSGRRQ